MNTNKSIMYNFRKKDITFYNKLEKNYEEIVNGYFSSINNALYNDQIIRVSRDKIAIKLHYHTSIDKKVGFNENQINNLGMLLSKLANKSVELELTNIKYPYIDRKILSKYIRLQTKKWNFNKIKKNLFKSIPLENDNKNNLIIRHILGLKIEISGRLIKERTIPRKTVSTAHIGTFIQKSKRYTSDNARYTFKNSKGALTVKIWINQSLFLDFLWTILGFLILFSYIFYSLFISIT